MQDEGWFRIGRVHVTTTVGVVLLGALGMLAAVVLSGLPAALFYVPQHLAVAQVWRVFTWPLADSVSFWSVLNLFFLWLFGRDLESQVGRSRMAWLFVGIWLSITVSVSLVGTILPGAVAAGLQLVEFAILLLWIAESPMRQFMFGIRAWVFGAVLLGIQVLQLIGSRMWPTLISLLLSLALSAIAARAVGLLDAYAWIPGGGRPATPSAPRPAKAAKPMKAHTHAQHNAPKRHVSDEERIDQLLDKINAEGIGSLTKGERAELEKLRQRRR
ncbi:rhomboid family intramembrane serine protease [Tessaracoccus sp.]|uniref:rhomboid family intramembrane serine protease n=1 Tax=Tessaracoccus sp. TaxID=1971211 RepID=UPI00260BD32F|nr:rhomboid family intramembrane serine protease [Tessaracoccus sp.]